MSTTTLRVTATFITYWGSWSGLPSDFSDFAYHLNVLGLEDWASLVAQTVKNPPSVQDTQIQSLGQGDLLEKEMAAHSSILVWRISWTEEPGWLQFMGLQRVCHKMTERVTLSLFTWGVEIKASSSELFHPFDVRITGASPLLWAGGLFKRHLKWLVYTLVPP